MATVAQANNSSDSMWWLIYSLLTVVCWGLYGIFLHKGQMQMKDAEVGRYKAFLLVGVAYFLTAVIAPAAMLWLKGSSAAFWSYPGEGIKYSLIAGLVGAAGAFGVLLAFGARGTPAVVMSIIFAGAPVVNAGVAIWMHPPEKGWGSLDWRFFLGIAMAAAGGFLVTMYKPDPPKPNPAARAAAAAAQVASMNNGASPADKG